MRTHSWLLTNEWGKTIKLKTHTNKPAPYTHYKNKDIPETQLTSLSKKKNTNVFTRLAFGLCLPLLLSIPSSSGSLRLKSLKEKRSQDKLFLHCLCHGQFISNYCFLQTHNTLLLGSIFNFERKQLRTSII